MMRAQEADPTNLEVLLAFGVSYSKRPEVTRDKFPEDYKNCRHICLCLTLYYFPTPLSPPWFKTFWKIYHFILVSIKAFCAINVAKLFNKAAQISPEDADVHIVLGVLYNFVLVSCIWWISFSLFEQEAEDCWEWAFCWIE